MSSVDGIRLSLIHSTIGFCAVSDSNAASMAFCGRYIKASVTSLVLSCNAQLMIAGISSCSFSSPPDFMKATRSSGLIRCSNFMTMGRRPSPLV